MNNVSDNAFKLACLLLDIGQEKRGKIISCLDSDLSFRVVENIAMLKADMPIDLRDTLPPQGVPSC